MTASSSKIQNDVSHTQLPNTQPTNNELPQTLNAIINISNLRLRTYIGFNEEEKTKQQDLIINAEIHYPADSECLGDSVDNALNYKIITKQIIQHVEQGRFLLLEKLVMDVLKICYSNPIVHYAKVKIDKPHALRFADSVSLTLEQGKPQQVSALNYDTLNQDAHTLAQAV